MSPSAGLAVVGSDVAPIVVSGCVTLQGSVTVNLTAAQAQIAAETGVNVVDYQRLCNISQNVQVGLFVINSTCQPSNVRSGSRTDRLVVLFDLTLCANSGSALIWPSGFLFIVAYIW